MQTTGPQKIYQKIKAEYEDKLAAASKGNEALIK